MGHQQRVVTLELHAESDEHLDKLLELAIFELGEIRKSSWNKEAGEVKSAAMEGSAGRYKLDYMISSAEVKTLIDDLLNKGYERVPSTDFYGNPCFQHPETQEELLIISDPPSVEKHKGSSF